jgi:hypothetical protein
VRSEAEEPGVEAEGGLGGVDPVGLTAAACGSAVGAGLAGVTATVLGVRALGRTPTPEAHDPGGALFYLLLAGTLGGIALAGAVSWTLLGPITPTYRRGGLALVSAFATALAMLVCIPVDRLLGEPGLLGLLTLCALAALGVGRRARRGTAGA